MPSARPSQFVSGAYPPQSAGLRAASGTRPRTDRRRQQRHPAKPGPLSAEKRDEVVAKTIELMDSKTPAEIAIAVGVSTEARPVREVIKEARSALQRRAAFYVEQHAAATRVASSQGDAKPSQWALERIAEGGDRIVDEPKAAPPAAPPQFNVGFVIGGIPMESRKVTASELPVLDATVQPLDMP
jgi:hypothetical protein